MRTRSLTKQRLQITIIGLKSKRNIKVFCPSMFKICYRPTGGSNVLGAGRYKPDQLTEAVSILKMHTLILKTITGYVCTDQGKGSTEKYLPRCRGMRTARFELGAS